MIRRFVRRNHSLVILNYDLFNQHHRPRNTDLNPDPVFDTSITNIPKSRLRTGGITDFDIGRFASLDPHFYSTVAKRARPIQEFLGPKFTLLDREWCSVIFGLSNLTVHTDEKSAPENTFPRAGAFTSTVGARDLGKKLFLLQMNLKFTFHNTRYLSLPANTIQEQIGLIKSGPLICEFMTQRLLYDCIVARYGHTRFGRPRTPGRKRKLLKKIRDRSCVGSFYTLIGILLLKYDRSIIIQEFLHKKVFSGPGGILQLASAKLFK